MARQKGQFGIFNDQEIELIKNTFADNDELIYAIRKLLLQFPVSEGERALIKASVNPDVYAVLKKRIHPEMDPELPLGQLSDLYQSLNTDLNSKHVDDMAPLFEAKQLEIDYLDQQFAALRDVDKNLPQPLSLEKWKRLEEKSDEERYVQTKARNFILSYVDGMLGLIVNIAGQKNETVEQAKERMKRDSSK